MRENVDSIEFHKVLTRSSSSGVGGCAGLVGVEAAEGAAAAVALTRSLASLEGVALLGSLLGVDTEPSDPEPLDFWAGSVSRRKSQMDSFRSCHVQLSVISANQAENGVICTGGPREGVFTSLRSFAVSRKKSNSDSSRSYSI